MYPKLYIILLIRKFTHKNWLVEGEPVKMKAIILLSIFMSLILFSSGLWGYKPYEQRVGVKFDNGLLISAEVADTRPAIQRGLMYRETLGEDEGMFFVFDHLDVYPFWMKNVNFPLDIVWLDNSYRVVHIERNVPGCLSETCATYTPPAPARFVLETRAGVVSANGITVGDVVTLSG